MNTSHLHDSGPTGHLPRHGKDLDQGADPARQLEGSNDLGLSTLQYTAFDDTQHAEGANQVMQDQTIQELHLAAMMEKAQLSFDNKDGPHPANDVLGLGSKTRFQLAGSLATPGNQSFRSNSTIMKRGPDSAYSGGGAVGRAGNLTTAQTGLDGLPLDKDDGEDDDDDSHMPNIIRNEDSRDYYDPDEDNYDLDKLRALSQHEELKESERVARLSSRKRYRVPAQGNQAFSYNHPSAAPGQISGGSSALPIGASQIQPDKVKVTRSQLSLHLRSKVDIYNILAREGQYYLPPISECTMDFIQQLLMGKKKVRWAPAPILTAAGAS